ncbi:Hypothetical protein SRAE_X000113300 [Strongyloides ratti]|uniref:Uncharacterized protein n=1 Tax=Strongyloides ratti TaxID=34506 RepID=A0A090KU44_STRRB|nr:Hypothetical protein SRAE_X000113300 [Strongyloides ratti]CEF59385.1 Hypothetical protein SRAE_X000113300 [Strongyloides ratti]
MKDILNKKQIFDSKKIQEHIIKRRMVYNIMSCSSIPTAHSIEKDKIHSGNVSHSKTENYSSNTILESKYSFSNLLKTSCKEENVMKKEKNNVFLSSKNGVQNSRYETEKAIRNTIALAVITRLHQWCCQLFWLTIICVMGACGDLHYNKSKTLQDIRKSLTKNNLQSNTIFSVSNKDVTSNSHVKANKKTKNVTQIEIQLLRHLTCPQTAILRPLIKKNKKRLASRPPSRQLFDIMEEEFE